MNSIWSNHGVEYPSFLKKNEAPTQAVTRMNADGITLSEVSQPPKDNYCRTLLVRSTWTDQIQTDEK